MYGQLVLKIHLMFKYSDYHKCKTWKRQYILHSDLK